MLIDINYGKLEKVVGIGAQLGPRAYEVPLIKLTLRYTLKPAQQGSNPQSQEYIFFKDPRIPKEADSLYEMLRQLLENGLVTQRQSKKIKRDIGKLVTPFWPGRRHHGAIPEMAMQD